MEDFKKSNWKKIDVNFKDIAVEINEKEKFIQIISNGQELCISLDKFNLISEAINQKINYDKSR